MSVIVLNNADIAHLLPMRDCIDVMADALAALARGDALLPLRQVLRLPDGKSAFAAMPAYVGTPKAIGAKVITVFPDNHGTGLDSHQGAVLLFEADHGSLVAVMDAASITAIRTAAVSGLATRSLARADAADVAILGTGVQARTHLEAMCVVRPVRRVRVWSRSADAVRAFADRESEQRGIPVEAAPSARAAVDGAQIICTVTASREPVLAGAWLAEGSHVNAVGASLPFARELDTAAVARGRFYVDRRESALNEAGDFLIPKREGAIGDDHIVGELGELVLGRIPGRRTDTEVTIFKSLGLAVEDVAAAHFLYERARDGGRGARVELGGEQVTATRA
jgi:ornithine cyclodeaminase/alanine dehydrogenase-like protein (mu-crystallin family)